MMEKMSHHIVEGEASESDEDEQSTPGFKHEPVAALAESGSQSKKQSVVVSGEASESDEEIDTSENILRLKVEEGGPITRQNSQNSSTDLGRSEHSTPYKADLLAKPKYDTLLHWKLMGKNADFRRNLCETIGQLYLSSAKEIKNTSMYLSKSQAAILDISHNMRLLTNDLFHLEDKFDIVSDCKLLPVIKNVQNAGAESADLQPSST